MTDGVRVTDLAPNIVSRLTGDPSTVQSPLGDRDQISKLGLIVLDGFGWDQLQKALHDGLMPALARLLGEGRAAMRPIRTVFPSMTPVVLTSILTGRHPSEHGIVGQVLVLPTGPVDILHDSWPEAAAPAITVPHLGAELLARGFSYHVLLEHRLMTGPLTQMLHGGSPLTTFIAASGFPVLLSELLDRRGPGAIYAYWSAIDTINHRRGAFDLEWRAEVGAIDAWLGLLSGRRRPATRLWVTADHGHVPITRPLLYCRLREELPWLPERPAEVGNGIGVSLTSAQRGDLEAAIGRLYAGQVHVCPVQELFEGGWFGPAGPDQYRHRIGTHMLWAADVGAEWMLDPAKIPHRWSHGGLSREEMEVPWVEIRLD